MKVRRVRLALSWVIALTLATGCDLLWPPSPTPPDVPGNDDRPGYFPNGGLFSSGGSKLDLKPGTQISPPPSSPIEVRELPEESVPALPAGKKAVNIVEVTPDGMNFDPAAELRFRLPAGHSFQINDRLDILQQSGGGWTTIGEARVEPDDFAIGEIRHTTVFALVQEEAGPGVGLDKEVLYKYLDGIFLERGYTLWYVVGVESTGPGLLSGFDVVRDYVESHGLSMEVIPPADATDKISTLAAAGSFDAKSAVVLVDVPDLISKMTEIASAVGFGLFSVNSPTSDVTFLYP